MYVESNEQNKLTNKIETDIDRLTAVREEVGLEGWAKKEKGLSKTPPKTQNS